MNFSEAVRSVLTQYATFTGRARRSEYWWFYLFAMLLSIVCQVVDAFLNVAFDNSLGVVNLVLTLALLLPNIAVTVRRLHDTGRTGWWILLPVVPMLALLGCVVGMYVVMFGVVFSGLRGTEVPDPSAPMAVLGVMILALGLAALVCGIVLLVFLCQDSQPGPNKFGPSPKLPAPPAGPGGYPYAGYGQPYPAYPPTVPYGYPGQPTTPPAGGYEPPTY